MALPRRNRLYLFWALPLVRVAPLLNRKPLNAVRRSETGPGAQPIMKQARYGRGRAIALYLTSDGKAEFDVTPDYDSSHPLSLSAIRRQSRIRSVETTTLRTRYYCLESDASYGHFVQAVHPLPPDPRCPLHSSESRLVVVWPTLPRSG